MYKYYFLRVLFAILLTTTAHAGSLVLEAELSDQDKTAMKSSFITPYAKLRENCSSYVEFVDLPTMTYVALVAVNLDEENAESVANLYLQKISELHEIKIDAHKDLKVHGGGDTFTEMAVTATSNEMNTLTNAIKVLPPVSENNFLKIYDSGNIVFGKINHLSGDENALDPTKQQLVRRVTSSLIKKKPSLSFTLRNFKLKYIDDRDNVIFSHPIVLGQVAQ